MCKRLMCNIQSEVSEEMKTRVGFVDNKRTEDADLYTNIGCSSFMLGLCQCQCIPSSSLVAVHCSSPNPQSTVSLSSPWGDMGTRGPRRLWGLWGQAEGMGRWGDGEMRSTCYGQPDTPVQTRQARSLCDGPNICQFAMLPLPANDLPSTYQPYGQDAASAKSG